MTGPLVRDVMTSTLVTVEPRTSYKEIVTLLQTRRIAAVPVVDSGRHVVGVVSETDLLYKEVPTLDEESAFTHRWHGRAAAKAAGSAAAEIMSAPAMVIAADRTVAEAARTMLVHSVKELPVVDLAERLVGLVTTHDILKIFLRPDTEIRHEILDSVFHTYLRIETALVDVDVHDGVVTLSGEVPAASQIPLAETMVSAVTGVVATHNRLTAAIDDRELPLAADTTDY